LQDLGQGYVVAALTGIGFRTTDSWKLETRTFVSSDGATRMRVIRPRDRENLFTPAGLRHIEDLAGSSRMVAFAYSSTLRRIYKRAPDSLEAIGPSIVLDLEKLRAATPDKIAVDALGRLP
jgi:hypothetical protein